MLIDKRRRNRFIRILYLFMLFAAFSVNEHQPSATAKEEFPLQLDHVLVWVTKGAPEAKVLENAGLQILDGTHQHTAQGTASKVFLFENLYLELIWIDDEEAAAKNAARTGIDMTARAQWRRTGASPFGVGLHRPFGQNSAIPFPVTQYWAEWMRPKTRIEFAETVTNKSEPMFFVVPDYISIGNPARQESLKTSKHRLGVSRLSNLKILTTGPKLTPTSKLLSKSGIMKVERGKAPLLELTFDGGGQKKSIDLRPQLPIVLRY
jgi:hypothetical protein